MCQERSAKGQGLYNAVYQSSRADPRYSCDSCRFMREGHARSTAAEIRCGGNRLINELRGKDYEIQYWSSLGGLDAEEASRGLVARGENEGRTMTMIAKTFWKRQDVDLRIGEPVGGNTGASSVGTRSAPVASRPMARDKYGNCWSCEISTHKRVLMDSNAGDRREVENIAV